MQYNSNIAGRMYELPNGAVYDWNTTGRMAAAYYSAGTYRVVLTGYSEVIPSGVTMYMVVGGGYIDLNDGWQLVGTSNVPVKSVTEAQMQVNLLIERNKHILQNNLLCARYADRLTDDQRTLLYELQSRLEVRNNRLVEDGLCTSLTKSYPKGYADLSNYLTAFMARYNGGIGSVAVTIIVTAVVIAATATAAYYAYRYYAEQALRDVKYSDELTKILTSKLTPEEYELLRKETAGMVTKQKVLSSIGAYGNILTWAALAVGGVWLYNYLRQ